MSEPIACARHTETEALLEVFLSERGALTARPAADGHAATFVGVLPEQTVDRTIAGTWRHFKGGMYLFITRVGGADEELVLYQYSDGGTWLRPLGMVDEMVERDGLRRPRFVRVTGSK